MVNGKLQYTLRLLPSEQSTITSNTAMDSRFVSTPMISTKPSQQSTATSNTMIDSRLVSKPLVSTRPSQQSMAISNTIDSRFVSKPLVSTRTSQHSIAMSNTTAIDSRFVSKPLVTTKPSQQSNVTSKTAIDSRIVSKPLVTTTPSQQSTVTSKTGIDSRFVSKPLVTTRPRQQTTATSNKAAIDSRFVSIPLVSTSQQNTASSQSGIGTRTQMITSQSDGIGTGPRTCIPQPIIRSSAPLNIFQQQQAIQNVQKTPHNLPVNVYNGLLVTFQQGLIHSSQQGGIHPSQQVVIQPSQQGVIQPSQRGAIPPSQQGVIHSSQQGVIHSSQQGVIHSSQQVVIQPSQQGVIQPSQQGVIQPSQQGVIHSSQQGVIHPAQQGVIYPSQQSTKSSPLVLSVFNVSLANLVNFNQQSQTVPWTRPVLTSTSVTSSCLQQLTKTVTAQLSEPTMVKSENVMDISDQEIFPVTSEVQPTLVKSENVMDSSDREGQVTESQHLQQLPVQMQAPFIKTEPTEIYQLEISQPAPNIYKSQITKTNVHTSLANSKTILLPVLKSSHQTSLPMTRTRPVLATAQLTSATNTVTAKSHDVNRMRMFSDTSSNLAHLEKKEALQPVQCPTTLSDRCLMSSKVIPEKSSSLQTEDFTSELDTEQLVGETLDKDEDLSEDQDLNYDDVVDINIDSNQPWDLGSVNADRPWDLGSVTDEESTISAPDRPWDLGSVTDEESTISAPDRDISELGIMENEVESISKGTIGNSSSNVQSENSIDSGSEGERSNLGTECEKELNISNTESDMHPDIDQTVQKEMCTNSNKVEPSTDMVSSVIGKNDYAKDSIVQKGGNSDKSYVEEPETPKVFSNKDKPREKEIAEKKSKILSFDFDKDISKLDHKDQGKNSGIPEVGNFDENSNVSSENDSFCVNAERPWDLGSLSDQEELNYSDGETKMVCSELDEANCVLEQKMEKEDNSDKSDEKEEIESIDKETRKNEKYQDKIIASVHESLGKHCNEAEVDKDKRETLSSSDLKPDDMKNQILGGKELSECLDDSDFPMEIEAEKEVIGELSKDLQDHDITMEVESENEVRGELSKHLQDIDITMEVETNNKVRGELSKDLQDIDIEMEVETENERSNENGKIGDLNSQTGTIKMADSEGLKTVNTKILNQEDLFRDNNSTVVSCSENTKMFINSQFSYTVQSQTQPKGITSMEIESSWSTLHKLGTSEMKTSGLTLHQNPVCNSGKTSEDILLPASNVSSKKNSLTDGAISSTENHMPSDISSDDKTETGNIIDRSKGNVDKPPRHKADEHFAVDSRKSQSTVDNKSVNSTLLGGARKHGCNFCNSSFSNVVELADHISGFHASTLPEPKFTALVSATKSRKDLFGCGLCEEKFPNSVGLQAHITEFHNTDPNTKFKRPGPFSKFNEDVTSASKSAKLVREAYLRTDNYADIVPKSNGKLKCRFCIKTFWYARNLLGHLIISHTEPDYIGKHRKEDIKMFFDTVIFYKSKISRIKEDFSTLHAKVIGLANKTMENTSSTTSNFSILYDFEDRIHVNIPSDSSHQSGLQTSDSDSSDKKRKCSDHVCLELSKKLHQSKTKDGPSHSVSDEIDRNKSDTGKYNADGTLDIRVILTNLKCDPESIIIKSWNTNIWKCGLCEPTHTFVGSDLIKQIRWHACVTHPQATTICISPHCNENKSATGLPGIKAGSVTKELPMEDGCNDNQGNQDWVCKTCRGTFENFDDMTCHGCCYLGPRGRDSKVLICQDCGLDCRVRPSFTKHVVTQHMGSQFLCHICSDVFNNFNQYLCHKCKKFAMFRNRSCLKCRKTFKTVDNLIKHEKAMHDEKMMCTEDECMIDQTDDSVLKKCEICAENFPTEKSLQSHVIQIHKVMQCSTCLLTFNGYQSYLRHLDACKKRQVVQKCRICNIKLESREMLCMHVYEDHKMSIIHCFVCKGEFYPDGFIAHACNENISMDLQCQGTEHSKQDVRPSMQNETPQNETHVKKSKCKTRKEKVTELWRCGVCKAKCKDEDSFLAHLGTKHDGIRSCRLCKKLYETKHICRLATSGHKQSNSNEEKKKLLYRCDLCRRSFKQEIYFHAHLSVNHDGIRSCRICRVLYISQHQCDSSSQNAKVDRKNISYKCWFCSENLLSFLNFRKHLISTHINEWIQINMTKAGTEGTVSLSDRRGDSSEAGTDGTVSLSDSRRNSTWCLKCLTSFSDESELETHVKQKHQDLETKQFSCHLCERSCPTVGYLYKHFVTNHFVPESERQLRYQRGLELRRFAENKRTRLRNLKRYKCDTCNESFTLFKDLKAHMEVHFSDNENSNDLRTTLLAMRKSNTENCTRFYCEKCGKDFSCKKVLSIHLKRHGSRTHICSLCGKGFFYKHLLVKHDISHSKHDKLTGDIICHRCGQDFKCTSSLWGHIRTHFGMTETESNMSCLYRKKKDNIGGPLTCSICNRRFKSKEYLAKHMKRHGAPTHICSLCGKGFFNKYLLVKHDVTHGSRIKSTGEVVCHRCGERFSCRNDLRGHVRIHFGMTETTYTDKKYSRKDENDVGPVTCSICNKILSNKKTLDMHKKLKHSKKKLSCPICFKPFYYNHMLKSHIKWIHENFNPIQCDQCGYRCYMKSSLVKHMKNHHS